MANVEYVNPNTGVGGIQTGTVIKTSDDSAGTGAQVQHVNVDGMPTVTVDASNLDIRDLSAATDGVTASFPGVAVDAFSRLRVSGVGQRFDVTFTYDLQPLIMDVVGTGSGTVTHDANLRAAYLTTGGNTSGDGVRFGQRFYNSYLPGNSQLIFITGNLNPDNKTFAKSTAEIGYGDTSNGIGFRLDSTGVHAFLRSSISGTAADLTVVDQADWDAATVGVDWTKSQIFGFDFQSLAVGRVRFYLDRGGDLVQVTEITNDNLRIGPYWQTASLPIYWSVYNDTTATETCRVMAVCATVKSEGSPDLIDLPGYNFAATRGSSTLAVSTSIVPLISLRVAATLNSLTNRTLVVPQSFSFVNDNPLAYYVYLNGVSSSDAVWVSDTDSGAEYDVTATAITGGKLIAAGFAGAGGTRSGATDRALLARFPLSNGVTQDQITIAAIRVGTTNAATSAAIEWKEIR